MFDAFAVNLLTVALQRCSGQDILKKGAPSGKGKHRLLIVLPVQLALPPVGADCRLGRLLHLLSPAPEYHLQIEQVRVTARLRFFESSFNSFSNSSLLT